MDDAAKPHTGPELQEVLTRVYLTIATSDSEPDVHGILTFKLGDGWMAVGAKRPASPDEGDELTGTVKTSKESAVDAALQVVRELLEISGLGSNTRPFEIGRPRRKEEGEE